jgi:hypothetical protein
LEPGDDARRLDLLRLKPQRFAQIDKHSEKHGEKKRLKNRESASALQAKSRKHHGRSSADLSP